MNFFIFFIVILLILIVLLKLFSTIISIISGSPSGETSARLIKKVFQEIDIKKNDNFVDLGSGFGNVVLTVNDNYHLKNITGYEISPLPYLFSKIRILNCKNIKINYQNMLQADLSKANIVFCYLWPELIQKIIPKLQRELPKGAILISPVFKAAHLDPVKILSASNKKIYIYKF